MCTKSNPTSIEIQICLYAFRRDGLTHKDVEAVEKEGAVFYQVELDGKGLKGLKDKKLVFGADGKEANSFTYWD